MLCRLSYLIALLVMLGVAANPLMSQEDTDSLKNETLIFKNKSVKSPRKASLYSAVLPGAGQIYNGKYWKAPIVWVGMGTFAYMAIGNQSKFIRFKDAYLLRQDGGIDEFYDFLTPEALINEMDRYRRFRDLNIIGATLFYVIQIVDANVDAALSDFDVSDDISLRISQPESQFAVAQQSVGFTLTLKF
ncbi:MAG: DUF5683 domain-containing protein [Bacteroidota bacterium]|nr:DUF5683 domain-containing protein [Bacteroidota bacterium]